LARVAKQFEVTAGAKGAAYSRENHAVDGPVGLRTQQRVHQFVGERQVQCVQLFRAIQTDDGDCAGAFHGYERSGGRGL
jgi:hypothetical protein